MIEMMWDRGNEEQQQQNKNKMQEVNKTDGHMHVEARAFPSWKVSY
jgi:hypothetical protein